MADEPKSVGESLREAIEEVGLPDDDAAPAAPAPKSAPRPAPEVEDRDELSEGIEERPRDPTTGRFLPRQGDESEEAPAKPAPQPKPRQPEQPEGEQPEAAPVQEPPKEETREQRVAKMTKNWRAEHREFLSKQPEDVQDFLIGRQAEMDAAYTRKSQRVALLESEYGPIHQMLEPELPAIRAAGYTPRLLIEGWANAERALLSGPESAATTLRNIAEGYRIPRELIAHTFGFDPRTPEQLSHILRGGAPPATQEVIPPNGNGAGYTIRDPRVDELLLERQEQNERAIIARNQQFRQAASQAQAAINHFRDAVDAKGNAMHPYFAEVEAHMTALAEFYGKRDGKVPPLKQLYEDAVNANPATRAKMLADTERAQSERRRQAEAARGKTEQARRAASSVVGQGSGRPNNRTQEKTPPKGAGIRASIDAAIEQVAGDQE